MKNILIVLILTLSLFASTKSKVEAERFSWKNGILTDSFSGLQWQDSKENLNVEKPWVTLKNWRKNEMFNTNGDTASTYCKKQSINGKHDWRLPTINELNTAYKIQNNFKYNHTYHYYWSSTHTPKYDNDAYAWAIYFNSAKEDNLMKLKFHNVRCVRSKVKHNDLALDDIILDKTYKFIKHQNTINAYMWLLRYYKRSVFITKSVTEDIYKLATRSNTIQSYKDFINEYPIFPQTKKAQHEIYKIIYKEVMQKNSIESYESFIESYPNSFLIKEANKQLEILYTSIYLLIKTTNTLDAYSNFIKQYPKAPQVNEAIYKIYNITKKRNNISGYEWFISKYSKASQVKEAIQNIHKLAYNKAKQINTITAYNTFIIAYPYASQVKDANDKAYNLESLKYTKMKKDDEKKARLLAVKIKKLTLLMKRKSNKDGYIIVKDRMIKLLTEQYEETDASLRYYESKEFTDFTETFENVMSSISSKLSNIEKYSSEILNTSKQGFEDAKADREMIKYKNEEHHKWDKRMHLMEKGYN